MKPGQKFRLAKITDNEINSMQLDWLWEPGMLVEYRKVYKVFGVEHPDKARVQVASGKFAGENIWVYNKFLLLDCIWGKL